MPRLTLLRVVLLFASCYLFLVGLWATLPNIPSTNAANDGRYQEAVLRSGNVLTTVYESRGELFRWQTRDFDARQGFGLDWQLIADEEAARILLRVGSNATIDLTHFAGLREPLISDEVIQTEGKGGDTDGVNLPWFSLEDSVLLYWEIQRDMQPIRLRVIVKEPGVVQVWPDHRHWDAEQSVEDAVTMFPSMVELAPLITISNVPTGPEKVDISQLRISDMTDQVPSTTFFIRRIVIGLLAPFTLAIIPIIENVAKPFIWIGDNIVFPLVKFIIMTVWSMIQCSLLYGLVVFVCWIFHRCPPFDEWSRSFILTRWLKKRFSQPKKVIWTSAGLIEVEDEIDGDHRSVHVSDSRSGRLHITSFRDLASSTSPLDDLLASFETTRWMTEPIGSSASRSGEAFVPSDGVLLEEGKMEGPKKPLITLDKSFPRR